MRLKMRALVALVAMFAGAAGSMAHEHIFETDLAGANENVPNFSPGAGTSTATLDLDLITLRLEVSFSGLTGTVTGATIFGPTSIAGTGTAGVMSPALAASGFPTGVTAGSYDFTFDLTVASGYAPTFITASGGTVSDALNALSASFEEGKSYINIQTTTFPSGEVRGFFTETPEPTTVSLFAIGGGIALLRRKRDRQTDSPRRISTASS
jgi:CHRD domain